MEKMKEIYVALRSEREVQLQTEQKRLGLLVVVRILAFLLLVLAVWLALPGHTLYWVTASVLFIGFLFAVRTSVGLKNDVSRSKAFIKRCEIEQACLNGDLSGQSSGGDLPFGHPWASDLDVVGSNSLFAFINRANSLMGKKVLRERLLKGPESSRSMLESHEAVKELAPHHELRVSLAATTSMLTDDELLEEKLLEWAETTPPLRETLFLRFMQYLVPVYSLVIIYLGFSGVIASTSAFILFALPLGLIGVKLKQINDIYEALGKNEGYFRNYEEVIETSSQLPHSAQRLANLHAQLLEAGAAMKALNRILSAFDQRNNLLVGLFANAIYLADLRNALKAVRWQKKYGHSLRHWLQAIGEIEFYASVATVYANFKSEMSFPIPSDQSVFVGEELVHPLMRHKGGVANDVNLLDPIKVMLVTGANMAGKSTYLRTIGATILMSRIGAPVFAKHFSIGDFTLYTSMRTTDSLDSGTSYFMAELKRLSGLIDLAATEGKVVALLDEILKGTNSVDKEQGSRGFVEQLVKKNIHAIVATHDISLCTLKETNPAAVDNKHFASEIGNNDLLFDYKLKEGVCDTMNATWLMKSMGIIAK
ncbi:MAG: tetratricopeptide (TPR) repeat protein [Flavobacteriales bacterium]|jgi:tetratricopeptide (TPR) repeat protein